MKLKSAAFAVNIFLPNGGGSKGDYVRDSSYDIVQEGAYLRIRVKDRKDGQIVSVPMPNVACLEFADSTWPSDTAPPVKK